MQIKTPTLYFSANDDDIAPVQSNQIYCDTNNTMKLKFFKTKMKHL